MDEIQNRFNIEWKKQFPFDQTPALQCLHSHDSESKDDMSDRKPREILQKLCNITRKQTSDLKNQLKQCEFIEEFLQGILAADNDDIDIHHNKRKSVEINALEECARQTINVSTGILLESNIDDIADPETSQISQDGSHESIDNTGSRENLSTGPPKIELLTTQKCDKKNFDECESGNDVHRSNDQINSSFKHEVTIQSDPLPRKFSGTSKNHQKPAVPPRRSERDSDVHAHVGHGIEIVPIRSVSGPIFVKSVNVVRENSTFKGAFRETDLGSDIVSKNICTDSNLRVNRGHSSLEDVRKQHLVDNSNSDCDESNMRKGRKSGGNYDQNVVVTSFRKISNENNPVTSQVNKSAKNMTETENTNDHLLVIRKSSDKPPGIPERKPSTDIYNSAPSSSSPRKRLQSRDNNYENISLDFILTRSQTFNDESPDSEENDEEELYDNVITKRPDNKSGNSESSLSSGGDNSLSSQSPKVSHDHHNSVRDSVFIRDEESLGTEDIVDKDLCDGDSHDDNQSRTEVRFRKVIEDDDSTEDNVSCDSLDDRKIEELETIKQERQKKLHMREIVVKGILESEKTYLQILQEITKIKRNLQTKSLTEHCKMLPLEDLSTIFYKIEDIKQYHQTFVNQLEEKVRNWSDDQEIGDIFKELTFYIPIYKDYVENMNKARDLVQKYGSESTEFRGMVSAMEISMTNGFKEKTTLEEALFKPVQRLQRNTLVLHDLLNHTPPDHPDYQMLNKALSLADLNIKSFGGDEDGGSTTGSSQRKPKEHSHLVKSGFVVEVVGNSRKLRFLFLYSDVIVCTKHKVSGRHKIKSFECKWFIPISNVNFEEKPNDRTYSCKEDIDPLKKRIVSLKSELRKEVRKNTESFREKTWSIAGKVSSRNIEKLKKKIEEQEAQLVLSSPHLPLHIHTRDEDSKDYTILISTDFEREEWRDAILSQQRHPHGMVLTRELSVHGIQNMINNSTQLPQVNNIGNVLSKKDEEMLSGLLNVTIHNLCGLDQPSDVFVILELDSYGHFFKKAQTHKCMNTTDPTWDEDFELELDGSQTLRILCYKVASPNNVLIGRSALELSKEWLSSSFKEQKISMNEISLTISVRHTTAAKTLKRTPSKLQGGIFGFKIKTVTMREGKTIPTFVSSCIRLVEQKGMDEVGIYRISGVTSEIQRIKKAFDKNLRAGLNVLNDADINAVTGCLKLYFRELPEPLFTEDKYTQFVDSLSLADEDSKEKCMLQLLHSLPDVNYYCIVAVIEHLVKVSKHESENKMSLNNLATIFGPTLLHPAIKDDTKVSPAMMMMQGAQDVFSQAAVLYYFLVLVHSGKSIRKSSKK